MDLLLLFVPALLAGWVVTASVHRIAPRFGTVVQPNPRSSHTYPTPTLGGIGLIAGMWAGLSAAAVLGAFPAVSWKPLACTLVVLLFCLDGFKPLNPLAKLALQVIAACLLILSGAVLTQITLPGIVLVELGGLAIPVTLLWYVGLQNLYDFMDGIDGLAGLEGILVAVFFSAVALGVAPDLSAIAIALAGGTTGFLILNRPPGRIFMGDVGGQFLGLIFALLAVLGEQAGIPFGLTILFLGAFLFDSVFTLLRRMIRRENITKAHRFHLYQRLVRLGWSHLSVDRLYGIVTILFGVAGYLLTVDCEMIAASLILGTLGSMVGGTLWLELQWARKVRVNSI